jgi:hypothetical protein
VLTEQEEAIAAATANIAADIIDDLVVTTRQFCQELFTELDNDVHATYHAHLAAVRKGACVFDRRAYEAGMERAMWSYVGAFEAFKKRHDL